MVPFSAVFSRSSPPRCIFSRGSKRQKKPRWAGSTYVSRNSGADEEGQIVRPGQKLVLLPPPLHDQAHVEAQDKRHGYGLAGVAEVIADLLENPAKSGPFKRNHRSFAFELNSIGIVSSNQLPQIDQRISVKCV